MTAHISFNSRNKTWDQYCQGVLSQYVTGGIKAVTKREQK